MAQIQRILVPTDFSENATSAYQMVKKTAEKYNATVDFIHVIQNPHYYNIMRDPLGNVFKDKDDYTKLRTHVEDRLNEELEGLLGPEYRGKVVVKNDERPSKAIAEHAKTERYDLIVIASRGYHQSSFVRGSVTEKLIRLTNTPVISINKGYDPGINTIVVPTDGSKVSFEALPMALLVAAQNNADVQLLRVSKVEGIAPNIAGESLYKYSDRELKEKILKSLKEYVSNPVNRLSFGETPSVQSESFEIKNDLQEIVSVSIVIDKGVSTHAAIVNYAKENSQLVVMATHGRSGMANLFLGSVTEKVVRHLKLPVLTIKPDFTKKKK